MSPPDPSSSRSTARLTTLAYAAVTIALALRHADRVRVAPFWDDALFFKRVAYNVVRHGFAGWNLAEGPVFVNTSQLFQLVAAGLLGLAPGYYQAAVIGWGAAALVTSLPLLAAAAEAPAPGYALLFFLWQAPPVLLAITTGMETPTVFLVLAVFLYALLRARARPFCLGALQWLVYLARPDAILLSFVAAAAVTWAQGGPRRAARFAAWAIVGVALIGLAFRAYYGTAVPLSTFLKVSPLSRYDHDYLSLDTFEKRHNVTQFVLLALPVVPLAAARRDATNAALLGAAALFVAFHGLLTYEVAAYHARFYAPALPFLFVAALRGLPAFGARRARLCLVALGAAAALLLFVAYHYGAIESARGYGPDVTRFQTYAWYALGVPAAGALLLARAGRTTAAGSARAPGGRPAPDTWLPGALACGLAAFEIALSPPRSWLPASDDAANANFLNASRAFVGADVIARCFEPPFQLTHSEIGLPGVLFPEAKIIDFTGLANRSIVDGTFDFEQLCRRDRPEFVFRPHPTHRALNRGLDLSACLRENYELAPAPRATVCPLYVRKDLFPRYEACAGPPP
jgi:hypothetical protein